jgi:hypothetical protein
MTRHAAISEALLPFESPELNLVGILSTSIPKQEGIGCWSIAFRRIFRHAKRLGWLTMTSEGFRDVRIHKIPPDRLGLAIAVSMNPAC